MDITEFSTAKLLRYRNGLEGLTYCELARHVVVPLHGAGGLEAISEVRRGMIKSK